MPYLKKVRINGEFRDISYSIRKDGRWVVRVNKGVKDYKDNGKPVYDYDSIYARGELELKQKVKVYFEELEEMSASKEILASDIFIWLQLTYWGKIAQTTYDRYEQILTYQIIPQAKALKHKRVVEIEVDDCKVILNNIKAKYSESTYKKAYTLLKAYFDDKVFEGKVDKNPVRFKQRGSKRGKKAEVKGLNEDEDIVFLSDEEIEKVKEVIYEGYELVGTTRKDKDGNRKNYKAKHFIPQGEFFIFMMNTGLRAGEAVALKYSDIDFDKHLMTVRSNVTYVKNRDESGEATGGIKRIEGLPKTDESYATVQINSKAIEILKNMLKKEKKGYKGYILHETREMSQREDNMNYISPHALYKRWQSVCKYAGIEPRGLHSLRHTCASHLFAATNGNAMLVSELLRHTDVSFTEKVYISIIKKYRDKVFAEFEV